MDQNTIFHLINSCGAIFAVFISYLVYRSKKTNKQEEKEDQHKDACNKEHIQHQVDIAVLKEKIQADHDLLLKLDDKIDRLLEEL
jgi:hypothetical protein